MDTEDTFVNRTVRLDTKGFCIFCLKRGSENPVNNVIANNNSDGDCNVAECKVNVEAVEAATRLRLQFSKVISRYLGATFPFLNTGQNDHLNDVEEDKGGFLNKKFQVVPQVDVSFICNDCSFLVEKICHLFHEMKKLEMELDWKGRQLKSIMAFAKRAPTRVKVFRERFTDSGTREDLEELERIELFRKEMLDKCSAKFRKIQPRIVFKRRGDPSSKSSRRKLAKRMFRNAVLHDVGVQTESASSTINSPLSSKAHSTSTTNSHLNDKAGSKDHCNVSVSVDNDDTTWDDARSPSPAPPSPAYSTGMTPEENGEDSSECLIRIRTIESLASPTKSVSPEKSPGRKTRSSQQRPSHNPIAANEIEIVEENQLQNGYSNRRPPRALRNQEPNMPVAPLSVPSTSATTPTSNRNTQMHDIRTRKATLTEWLQSTFNCDKCNKMFMSESTLSTHKMTCGVVEETRQADEANEQEDNDDDDAGESPMDISHADDSSDEEQEDPLAADNPVELEEPVENSEEAPPPATKTNITRTTIRILTNAPPATPPSAQSDEMRYCKYCNGRYSKKHFMRHRQTLKHKQNKRMHKKAKKQKSLVNTSGSGNTAAADDVTVIQSNGTVPDSTAAIHAASSSTAIVTVGREENNVKVVKIIRLTKNVSEGGGDLNIPVSLSENQETRINGEGENENGDHAQAPNHNNNNPSSSNNENEIIDISDD